MTKLIENTKVVVANNREMGLTIFKYETKDNGSFYRVVLNPTATTKHGHIEDWLYDVGPVIKLNRSVIASLIKSARFQKSDQETYQEVIRTVRGYHLMFGDKSEFWPLVGRICTYENFDWGMELPGKVELIQRVKTIYSSNMNRWSNEHEVVDGLVNVVRDYMIEVK